MSAMDDNDKKGLKLIGRTLVGVLLFNALSPLSVLAQEKGTVSPMAQRQMQQLAALNQRVEQARADKALTAADRAAQDFKRAEDLVRSLREDARARQGSADASLSSRRLGEDIRAQQRSRLKDHLSAIRGARDSVRAEFAETGRELKAKNVPAEILQRHEEAVAQFEQRAAEFESLSQAWIGTDSDEALTQLEDFFRRHPAQRKPAARDPKKLPWSTPEPTKREPAMTQTAWFQQLWGDRSVRLAQAGSVGPINFEVLPEPGQSPEAGDLAETPETQQTDAIRAKANELGNNPVNIHNWVRNTVEWVPTWGAVQSAEDTLQKRRGNAHDIASLEIALLRAAKIPARYQWGTIELGAEQVQNWVGGVSVPQAAQQLLGQGGIANMGLLEGGRVSRIRMEHVWVQAYVNWAPSRGARQGAADQHVNPNGPLNAWVSLDPSFKQYTYSQGMDLERAVPLDASALLSAMRQGATVNETEGWVQNLNQSAVQTQLADYQARLKAYIDSQDDNASAGEVVGRKIVPVQTPPLLADSSPYKVVQTGQKLGSVPSSLRHKFTYRLYASQYDKAYESPILSYSENVSALVGKRFTLSYVPATQADADLIASYMPKAHPDGSQIQASEFPAGLPGYLIRLKPQLNLDGRVVATASQSLVMGSDIYSSGGFTRFDNPTQWDITDEESNTVGNATAIGISAQGVGVAQLKELNERLELTKSKLQAGDFGGLNGEQLAGDLLVASIWSWFVAAENHGRLSKNQAGMVEVPGLSYGIFHAIAKPIYSWGVIRRVVFPGVNLDIGHVRQISWSKQNDRGAWVAYNRLRGQHMSALEHAVLERFFNDSTQCSPAGGAQDPALPVCRQGVSAINVMEVAGRAGQKVFSITQAIYGANQNIVSSRLAAHSFETRQAIQSRLDAGYEVATHEMPVEVSGWRGSGYIFVDPQTGAGGYIIEGGSNGGELLLGTINGFGLAALLGGYAFGAAAPFMLALAVILVASIVATLIALALADDVQIDCYYQGIGTGFGIYGVVTAILAHYGVLGGAGEATSIGKLLVNLLVPFFMDRFIANSTVQSCL